MMRLERCWERVWLLQNVLSFECTEGDAVSTLPPHCQTNKIYPETE